MVITVVVNIEVCVIVSSFPGALAEGRRSTPMNSPKNTLNRMRRTSTITNKTRIRGVKGSIAKAYISNDIAIVQPYHTDPGSLH